MGKQVCDRLFGIGIVADTPAGMINRPLQINQQQHGAFRRFAASAYVVAGLSAAKRALGAVPA